jgi:heme exporter protein A
MLTATNLACVRGERELFAGLDISLTAGSWLQVSGENGAGKTSLLRMLCGLAPPASGEILWDGAAIGELGDAYRENLLYLGHQTPIKDELSARENLEVSAAINGTRLAPDAAAAALTRMGMAGREDLPVRFLSQGQKRRAALALLLIGDVPLWILDEPFAALDAPAANGLAAIIGEHLARGGLAVLTSHQDADIAGAKQTLRIAP